MRLPLCAATVALCLAAGPLAAQATAARDRTLDAIAANIRESYVFPEKRGAIVARLERSRRNGRYPSDNPGLLADRVTEDLFAASGDGHLYLLHDPAQYAAAVAQRDSVGESTAELDAYWRDRAIREYHGLTETRVLPGNLRYLKLASFHWVRDETGIAYDAAMRFLKGGDAAIIDLRGNGGGSHGAVQYLVSHFLGGDSLEMTFLQSGRPPSQSRTLEHLPAGRLVGKPLYVLIDGGVASAGEAFAYDVQQFHLGELIGAPTAGGANNNKLVPIAPGFMLSVSVGRPVHAVSGTNWEGKGVEPSVPAAPERALEVAESLALHRLAKAPQVAADRLADYEWARVGLEARLRPVSLGAAKLEPLAGRYGEMAVEFREGMLWLSRRNRPTRRLSPLTEDGLFSVEGSSMRVRFTAAGLEAQWQGDPDTRRFDRS